MKTRDIISTAGAIVLIAAMAMLLIMDSYGEMSGRQEACGDREIIDVERSSFKCVNDVNGNAKVIIYYKVNDKWLEVEK